MSFLRDKYETLLADGDFVDVRLKIIQCDEVGRTLICRVGGGNVALGTGTTNPSPDSGVVVTFKPGDVVKV